MANVGPPAEVQVLQSAILVLAPRALAHPQPNLLHVLQIFEAQGHIRNLLPRIHTKSIMRRSNLAVSVGPFKQCISFDLCSAGQIKTFFGSLDCLQCLSHQPTLMWKVLFVFSKKIEELSWDKKHQRCHQTWQSDPRKFKVQLPTIWAYEKQRRKSEEKVREEKRTEDKRRASQRKTE